MSSDRVVHASESRPHLLQIYLNDHLAGAAGGTGLARRLAQSHKGTAAERALTSLVREVEDKARLEALIERADQQLATIERLRVRAVREALAAS